MVRPRNVEKFHVYVVDLLNFLRKLCVTDEKMDKLLIKVFSKHRQLDKLTYLEYTLNNIEPHINAINQQDEFIFTPEFSSKPLVFLIGLDFKLIWKKQLTSEEKRIILRYLEFLYIQGSLALGRNKQKVKDIIEGIQAEQEIEKEALENPDLYDDSKKGGLAALFGSDNLLMELAQDIGEEFNLQETLATIVAEGGLNAGGNPMDMIQNLTQNPKMKEILQNLSQSVHKKMEEKNISQEDLLKSAADLKNNFANNLSSKDNIMAPQLKRMLKNFDFEKLSQQFQQDGGQSASPMVDPADFASMMNGGNQDFSQMMEQMKTNPEFSQMMEQLEEVAVPLPETNKSVKEE